MNFLSMRAARTCGLRLAVTMALLAGASWSAADDVSLAGADVGRRAAPEPGGRVAENQKGATVSRKSFGKTPDGADTILFTLTNKHGMTVQLTDYGARIVTVDVPDRAGRRANVNLGLDSAEKYAEHTAFFGCVCGRYANRIAKGRFTLDGKEYKLATNNGPNHLHGGLKGFDRYVWGSDPGLKDGSPAVRFQHRSPDGDEGFPGTMEVVVTYSLNDNNELRIDYSATSDAPTVLNLTNHAYWNLAGAGSGDVLGHKLTLTADDYLAVDDGLIPTGKLVPVKGTFMDFTSPQTIGSRIAETKRGVPPPGGYDHCYVLRNSKGELALAARVEEPGSGRVMEISTTEPAIQLYTGNFLDGSPKNGGYGQHAAFCLETQHYPDSPNRSEFPSTVLRPGKAYTQTTVYKFSVK